MFRYPVDPKVDYVMRVIGIPGDTIAYIDKRLSVNNNESKTKQEKVEVVVDSKGTTHTVIRHQETLDNVNHLILLNPDAPPYHATAVRQFAGRQNCQYQEEGFVCKVPPDHYFVMGDNRDMSSDSRYWGFVPEGHFAGRVFLIWYSSQNPDRAGMVVE